MASAASDYAAHLSRACARIGHSVLAVAVPLILAANASNAESVPAVPDSADAYIEEIVVTGTRIKRRDFHTASPLTTIDHQVIEFTGQPTLEETLNQMPQVLPQIGRTGNNPSLGNNPGIGGAEVDLRGMGPNRTLVLLNGRRVAPASTDNRVDLNTIPQQLVDRIEIITGGTSAVYGSDALAGVVNFITRDDFSGIGIETSASMAEPGDAAVYTVDLAYGHNLASGRGNFAVYGSLLERKSLLAGEREFVSVPYGEDTDTGELVAVGSVVLPEGLILFPFVDINGVPEQIFFGPDGNPRVLVSPDDSYNYQPPNYLQVPLRRLAAGVMGSYDLSGRIEAYLEASYVRNEPTQQTAPAPGVFPFAEINLDNPLLTPATRQIFTENFECEPGSDRACVVLFKRPVELGPRIIEHERDYYRVVAGLRGKLWRDWNIDGWLSYTDASSTERLRNAASQSRLLQGLLVDPISNECFDPTGGCVPLNVFGEGNLSPEGVAFIRVADMTNRTQRKNKLASVFVSGAAAETWAGPLDMAFGLEWRSDELSFQVDDRLQADNEVFASDTIGYNLQSSIAGTDEVFEIYGEALVPLADNRTWAKQLALEVGGRISNYKHSGTVSTYKAGAEWEPIDGVRLRAMHQRSVRAPNSGELFEERQEINGSFAGPFNDDLCSASADPIGNGFEKKCLIQGLPEDQIGVFEATILYPSTYFVGGNLELESETAETWTVGTVLALPSVPSWTMSVDYFSLEISDVIGDIDAGEICFDPANTSHVICDKIRRDATGNVSEVEELTQNRGLLETTGIDTQIQYTAELPRAVALQDGAANINVSVYWTHMFTNKEQESPAASIIDCAGYFGGPCDTDERAPVYPKNRVTSNVHYSSGSFGAHFTWRWIEGTGNGTPLEEPDAILAIPSISDKHYFDLGADYQFGDNFTVRAGITNLTDTDPPLIANIWDVNTATSLYDVFGRSYYLTLSARF